MAEKLLIKSIERAEKYAGAPPQKYDQPVDFSLELAKRNSERSKLKVDAPPAAQVPTIVIQLH